MGLPQTLYRGFAPGHHSGDLRPPDPLFLRSIFPQILDPVSSLCQNTSICAEFNLIFQKKCSDHAPNPHNGNERL